ncbi:lysozyme family protein [Salinicoccus albus]|uniref:lysozyme family protein n=1 Tax=Salinicoccus albus TaxID=418756 RepID=UPI0024808DD3|nr:lysozyme family protein [Salinicoccus albus]
MSAFGAEESENVEEQQSQSYEKVSVPEGVQEYEDDIKSELEDQNLDESFSPVLLAIASQESGGRVPDIFQSSESLGLPPNSIGPEESIEQGVKYFKELADSVGIESASDEGLDLVLQSYNFGEGFIDYAKERGGYSQETANEFSDYMADESGWSSYGDPKYVSHVNKYMGSTATGDVEGEVIGDMALPLSKDAFMNDLMCDIGCYYDAGSDTPHPGYDWNVPRGTKAFSMVDGTVIEVSEGSPDNPQGIPLSQALTMDLGNYIRIIPDNNKGVVLSYFHLTGQDNGVMVEEGMKVEKGQVIGHSGNSGRTTGEHLHVEMLVGGDYHIDSAIKFYDEMKAKLE